MKISRLPKVDSNRCVSHEKHGAHSRGRTKRWSCPWQSIAPDRFAFLIGFALLFIFVLPLNGCNWPSSIATHPHQPHLVVAAKQEHTERIDRIILTWKEDPATSQAVTWRTTASPPPGVAELAPAGASPDFRRHVDRYNATTTALETESGLVYYHSVNFVNLQPDNLYAYRVGSGHIWSEWFHFRTALDRAAPFSFLYFGDAQNDIHTLWSRTVRAALLEVPRARFMIHAGDLVNQANSDGQWQEWFEAGGWIFGMIPSIPVVGNHEYRNWESTARRLSDFWRPQFALPEHSLPGLEETVYYTDYQGVRIVVLNSNEKLEEQAQWLQRILEHNSNHWTIIAFHHPVFPSGERHNDHPPVKFWKPIFDKFDVDMVLQGHDHVYARGRDPHMAGERQNGPVYVTSVSGSKMYKLGANRWMDRAGENMQLFQAISASPNTLNYRAITATGHVYDAFDLLKSEDGQKELIEPSVSE